MTTIEKALINSEEYIRKLFEGIPIPIYVWQHCDNDFILVDYNDAAKKDLKGKDRIKKEVKASIFYRDNPEIIQDLNKCFIRKKTISKDRSYTVKSTQELKYLSIRYSYIPPELVLMHNEDITEKKLAKQQVIASEMKCKQLNKELEHKVKERTKKLVESEKNYRELLDNLDVGFYQVTLDGHMINLNQAHKIILGYDPSDDLKDKDVRMFWKYPEQREVYITQLLKKGSVKDYICHSLTKDGKELIVQLNSHLIRDKEGIPIRVDGTFIDITEKFKLEQKIKESEANYRAMTELLPDIIYEADLNLDITYVNETGFEKFGYTPEDLKKGVNIKSLISQEYIEKAFSKIKSIFNGEITEPNEYLVVRKDGTKFYARINSRPIIKNDKVIGLRGTVTDINDMVIAEQNLKESEIKYREAYDRASFYKDIFAHDINNILQIMNSSAELISLQLKNNEQSKDIENITEIIRKQVIRGTKLVHNVTILSALEENEISIQSLEVYNLLLKSIEYVKRAYNERDLVIQIDSLNKEIFVIANDLLQDVFENILINAVKYNDNPTIEIIIKIFRQKDENNKFYRFEFTDNGIGVSDNRKNSIFKRVNGDSKSSKGMGLGLSLVSKIIEYYNGKIWIEDRVPGDPSKGSNFIILLPETI